MNITHTSLRLLIAERNLRLPMSTVVAEAAGDGRGDRTHMPKSCCCTIATKLCEPKKASVVMHDEAHIVVAHWLGSNPMQLEPQIYHLQSTLSMKKTRTAILQPSSKRCNSIQPLQTAAALKDEGHRLTPKHDGPTCLTTASEHMPLQRGGGRRTQIHSLVAAATSSTKPGNQSLIGRQSPHFPAPPGEGPP